jgi:hypothetical protein
MTFRRTVVVGTVVWVAGITLLQVYLNGPQGHSGNFHVGFLPVT